MSEVHQFGVVGDEIGPLLLLTLMCAGGFELLPDVAQRVCHFQMAGVGHSQSIGSIEILRKVGKTENALQNGSHLFFGGIAIPCNTLFDNGGFILGIGQVATNGSPDSHTLRLAEFEHGLHILAGKRGLDGKMVGMVRVDDALGGVEDFADAEMEVGNLAQIKHIHDYQLGFGTIGVEEAISQNLCARVYTEYQH